MGGLPTPRLLYARLTCDCIHRVLSLWAETFGAQLFEIDYPGASDLPPRWWELGCYNWRELVEPHRLAFVVSTLERLVERLDAISGRPLDRDALRERLELVSQQEEVFDAVRRLIAAAAAGVIISAGYVTAIVVNLGVGLLVDRCTKPVVLGLVSVILCVASVSLTIENLATFRVATATVIGFGFSAANQLYGLAGSVMLRHEAGHAMGVVSLGAGLFGYFGPQMLGILRDLTGSFAAGFYMVAIADVLTLTLIAALYRMTRGARHI